MDRHNFTTMTRYISNPENLKLMMTMLRDRSKNIQFEAFHVFKVFVANPNKTKPIQDILLKNKDKLVEFLTKFHNDRTGLSTSLTHTHTCAHTHVHTHTHTHTHTCTHTCTHTPYTLHVHTYHTHTSQKTNSSMMRSRT